MIKQIGLPDYVHLLSGQDFPLKNSEQIEDFFKRNSGRNFIEFEPLPRKGWHLGGMDRIEYNWFNDSLGYKRTNELIKYQKPKKFIPEITPYGGSQWWSLTGECVAWLFGQCRDGNEIYDYYKPTLCPDEMLFQTMLLHSPYKGTLINTNLRKIDWSIPGPHPHIWLHNDVETLKKTTNFFARKFDDTTDEKILDEIEIFISQLPVKKDMPSISIVMPVYNVPPNYLRESIESILNQTFCDFELLIIDDGSTETEGIDLIKSYQDSRIRLITNPHNFIDSLNIGIAESKGKYIARMDTDDIMLPHRLQVQYNFMEEHPEVDVCGSWIETFGNGNDTVQTLTEPKEIVTSLLLNNTMAHPTVILRKATVCKNGTDLYKTGYDYAEDYKLWTELALKGLRFTNIPEVLLKYRSSEKQVTNIRWKEMNQSVLKIQTEYSRHIMQEIAAKNEKFFDFFEHLIELLNQSSISPNQFLNIIYHIYI